MSVYQEVRSNILKKGYPEMIALGILIIYLVSLFFYFRAITSILTALIFFTAIVFYKKWQNAVASERAVIIFVTLLVIFFAFQWVALSYTSDINEGWRNIWTKSSVPLTAIGSLGVVMLLRQRSEKLRFYYCLIIVVAALYCLSRATINYVTNGEASVFFYYQILAPIKGHAIFSSIYVFAAIVFLMESFRQNDFFIPRGWYVFFTGCLVIFLLLLSSKLAIGFFVLYILIYIFHGFKSQSKSRYIAGIILISVAITVFLSTKNQVSRRFAEILSSDMKLVSAGQNHPADYFNGLQFRILQWRLVPEILEENRAWIVGVSPGDAQHFLDKKYIQRNMYVGSGQSNDRGFLGFYTHNTFLEALLQLGIAGLLIVAAMFWMIVRSAWLIRSSGSAVILLLIIALAFTESLFETQYGICLLGFLPLFVYLTTKQTVPGANKGQ